MPEPIIKHCWHHTEIKHPVLQARQELAASATVICCRCGVIAKAFTKVFFWDAGTVKYFSVNEPSLETDHGRYSFGQPPYLAEEKPGMLIEITDHACPMGANK